MLLNWAFLKTKRDDVCCVKVICKFLNMIQRSRLEGCNKDWIAYKIQHIYHLDLHRKRLLIPSLKEENPLLYWTEMAFDYISLKSKLYVADSYT